MGLGERRLRVLPGVEVREPDECWPWSGTTNSNGYGRLNRKSTDEQYAHRAAYELAYGPVPSGLDVLHSCDNPPCCNPAHLRAGTRADNCQDMLAKGRQAHWRLAPEAVRAIRASGERQVDLARRYGVGQAVVSRIRSGRTYRDVT